MQDANDLTMKIEDCIHNAVQGNFSHLRGTFEDEVGKLVTINMIFYPEPPNKTKLKVIPCGNQDKN